MNDEMDRPSALAAAWTIALLPAGGRVTSLSYLVDTFASFHFLFALRCASVMRSPSFKQQCNKGKAGCQVSKKCIKIKAKDCEVLLLCLYSVRAIMMVVNSAV
jgi:hypothetical protein